MNTAEFEAAFQALALVDAAYAASYEDARFGDLMTLFGERQSYKDRAAWLSAKGFQVIANPHSALRSDTWCVWRMDPVNRVLEIGFRGTRTDGNADEAKSRLGTEMFGTDIGGHGFSSRGTVVGSAVGEFETPHGLQYFLLHAGFLHAYDNVREPLRKMLDEARPRVLRISGHSLGAAMAVIFGFAASRRLPDSTVELLTFALPNVGDDAFAAAFAQAPNLHHVGYMLDNDLVKGLPHALYTTAQMNHTRDPRQYPPPRETQVSAAAPAHRQLLLPVSTSAVFGDELFMTSTAWRSMTSHLLTSYMLVLSDLRLVFSDPLRTLLRPDSPILRLIVSIRTVDETWKGAGTNDDVYLDVLGTTVKLDTPWHDDFEPGNTDKFDIPVPAGTTVRDLRESGYALFIDNHATTNWSRVDRWLPEWVTFEVETGQPPTRVHWTKSVLNREGREPYTWIDGDNRRIERGTWPRGWGAPINPELDFVIGFTRSVLADGLILHVLDVPGPPYESGVQVQLYRRAGPNQDNQIWRIEPVPSSPELLFIYPIRAPHLVLNVLHGSVVTLIDRARAGGAACWHLEQVGKDRFLLVNGDNNTLRATDAWGHPLNANQVFKLTAEPLTHGMFPNHFAFLPYTANGKLTRV